MLLEVKDLKTYFHTRRGVVKAVNGVSFTLDAGKTLGLVGESGSGKSITALSLLRLVPEPAGRIAGGEILLDGEDLVKKSAREMRRIRGAKVSMILQDSMMSLNPVYTVGNQVAESIIAHQSIPRGEVHSKVVEMLRLVRIPAPERRAKQYPHEMSGGMRQRVSGAIAFSCQPSLLICDEPTTSLDVTIQAQYLKLLKDIQRETGVAVLFITHDLGVVAKICDDIAVMYAGRIVEMAPAMELLTRPMHPYTEALMKCLPSLDKNVSRLPSIQGAPPTLLQMPPGCSFWPRCPDVRPACKEQYPPFIALNEHHSASCWKLS
ncbi:MAG: ABC transporter ATP-binding protein [Dehalococcoidia bacterium]|nr:ABC transporter ATP-binding protein [Dehalococcoidia bacterium]